MGDFFFNLGRRLGRATVPSIRKVQWLWHNVTGNQEDAIRAENAFGRAWAAEMGPKLGVGKVQEDSEWIKAMSRRLAGCVRNKLRRFTVEVIPVDEPNAMALPGGYIYVGDSLIEFCDRDPDEVAFVVGHEMAHVIRGHTFERVVSRVGIEVVATVLSRGMMNPWLRQSGLKLMQSAHSQKCELEADELGLKLARAAGYGTQGAMRLFGRLAGRRKASIGLGEYFSSHPSEADRREHLQRLISQTSS